MGHKGKGHTRRPLANYYQEHNEDYDEIPNITQKADAAWYTHKLPGHTAAASSAPGAEHTNTGAPHANAR